MIWDKFRSKKVIIYINRYAKLFMQEFKEKKNWNSISKTLKYTTNQIMNKSLFFYKLKIKITKKKIIKK